MITFIVLRMSLNCQTKHRLGKAMINLLMIILGDLETLKIDALI
jgi:hypothetical protein